jgi:hypothetical protein
LPGNSCGGSSTQFSLHQMTPPLDHPWQSDDPRSLGPPPIFILSYTDSLVRDAFPEVPTTDFNALLFTVGDLAAWNFMASVELQAINDAAPVPEPGTLALLGLGLAAAARARRRA